MNSIFEYRDYKQFILDRIASLPHQGRGIRKKLSEALNCQNTFISHVLAGNYHLSLEQAERAGRFFHLSREETEYLLLLVSHNRSGTKELGAFLEKWLEEKKQRDLELKNRLKIKATLDREDQAIYLSHWYYAIIHNALTIPTLRTPDAIAMRLRIDENLVRKILDFLQTRGLAVLRKGQYRATKKELHFGRDSPLLSQLHRNFRALAVNSLDNDRKSDLHYSAVVSCSKSDVEVIKIKLTRTLEECAEIIRRSGEEDMAVINIDWFQV
ncbi:MAG: TIGR02147 family protein [Oligoflexia bacterium]|nr:TIGR02147 family protein [Oligoflexia bacterium]